MPWNIAKRGDKWCVVKEGETTPIKGGCHASRSDALKHQRALYANEPSARRASIEGVAPLAPPKEWFEIPEADPTPLAYSVEGRVFGHLALWDTCHTGFLNGSYSECVRAPRSTTDYQQFHLGLMETAEGDMVPVGKITFDTSHAPLTADLRAAARHYDDTGSVGAFVRARDGQHGIWLSGVRRSDLSPEGLRDLRANPPSGDWRVLNHNLELVASLAVPVPGFPITRSQLALAASADGGLEVTALILAGIEFPEEMDRSTYLRKRKTLTAAVLTSKKRKSLSKGAFAIPEERAYPIHDRAHAANALSRSAGKSEEARVRRAVCRRYPDMPACRSR